MRVLAFRHVPLEGLGRIETALSARGIACQVVDLYQPDATVPDAAGACGLIFMGGPMSVNDPLDYLRREEDLIRAAVRMGMPVLGVCLGAQLIASALGARVYRNPVKEIGWFDVSLTAASGTDPLFEGLPERDTVFHWHGETFDLPEGAVLLASSERCRHQAFRAGPNVYGLQYHLEVTPEMIADWCRQDANCGGASELRAPLDPSHNAARLCDLAGIVFGRWSGLVR